MKDKQRSVVKEGAKMDLSIIVLNTKSIESDPIDFVTPLILDEIHEIRIFGVRVKTLLFLL